MKNRVDAWWVCRFLVLGVLLLTAIGCGNRESRADRREENYPLLRRAIQKRRDGDIEEAIALSHRALERRPGLARAHLELGLMYDEPWGTDYLRAIYHYMRYLDMRPDTERREIVEGLVVGAQFAFAASIPDQPSAAVREIARLREEVRVLQERVMQLQEENVRLQFPRGTARRTTGLQPLQTEQVTTGQRTYEVRSGDTLSRIAERVYNDATAWEIIYDANRDRLSNPRMLREGMELVIPERP